MEKDFEALLGEGWEKILDSKGKFKFYLAPPQHGIRRKVHRASQLKGNEIPFALVLFPKSSITFNQESKQKDGESVLTHCEDIVPPPVKDKLEREKRKVE